MKQLCLDLEWWQVCVVYQEEDEQGFKGLKVSKDLMEIGGDALKTNIATLAPLVLPFSEKLLFFSTLLWREFFSGDRGGVPKQKKLHFPDYKKTFEHFVVHAASKSVLNELQKKLELGDKNMEASRMTLHQFGNTSSSSIWYQLAYLEAKDHGVKSGARIWQLAFGSGFMCVSLVWCSVRRNRNPSKSPWLDCIHGYPVQF